MFWKDVKRSVLSLGMLLSLVIGILLLIEPVFPLWRYWLTGSGDQEDVLNYFFTALALGGYLIFTPLLTVLPGILSFCEEWNTGYIKYILARRRPGRYIVCRMVSNGVVSGLATTLPLAAFMFLSIPVLTSYTASDMAVGRMSPFHETIFRPLELIWGGWGCVLAVLGSAFVFGIVWGTLALGISACFPNRYVSLCAPFMLFFSLHIGVNAVGLWQYSPMNTLLPDVLPSFTFLGVYQLVLLTVGALLCVCAMRRRLRHV